MRISDTQKSTVVLKRRTQKEIAMDLSFTPEEEAFRADVRGWVKANLPKDLERKVRAGVHLSRDDMQGWAKILGKKGWLGYGWPSQFGGPGCLKKSALWPVPRAWCLLAL
jgi:alkylation response protein AidB-like acyl-CoA dehydrogenase